MNENYFRWPAALVLSAASLSAFAHGDEPHGDEPHSTGTAAASEPRFEAATEAFEMVGRLENGALTLFINRFETSEPVLQAKVELESGEHKAVASFRPGPGSYVMNEPKFITALSKPGEHPVVVTLTSGNDTDLLEATLNIAATAAADENERSKAPVATLAGTLGVGVLGAGMWFARRRRSNRGDRA